MPFLSYIDDSALFKSVDHLLTKAQTSKDSAEKKFNSNVIDPFSPLFEMSGFDTTHREWVQSELTRQSQKSVSNNIGLFHQSILGAVNAWEDLGTGGQIDLVNHERRIIAEVKNKYNTVKGSDLKNVYYELDDLISRKASSYKDYTAYFVTIIPPKPLTFDKPFTPSDKERGRPCKQNDEIRHIDGVSFYQLVTGREKALEELFLVLPQVIEQRSRTLQHSFLKYTEEDKQALQKYFNTAY